MPVRGKGAGLNVDHVVQGGPNSSYPNHPCFIAHYVFDPLRDLLGCRRNTLGGLVRVSTPGCITTILEVHTSNAPACCNTCGLRWGS